MTLVDTHTHLDGPARAGALPGLLDRARAAEVEWMVAIGTAPDDWDLNREVMRANRDRVRFTVGIHPCSVEAGWEWTACDRYVMHQVSAVHTTRLCDLLDVDMDLVPLTYPEFGNMGPAAVPYTLSTIAEEITPGERVLLMGIGSGLNCAAAELVW